MSRSRWADTWEDFRLWMGLHGFAEEVPFKVGRRVFRFDFAREGDKLAVEYDGFGRGKGEEQQRGGHETRSGVMRDARKGNEAQLAGWRLIRCHAATIEDGSCHAWVERGMEQ